MYFRTLIQIIVLVLLLLVESTASVDCSSQQPSVCAVLPPEGLNINSTHALKLLRNSFVNATGNVTVYAGQTARFIIELDKSIVSDVSPVAYVDGCSDSAQTNCQLIEDNVQMKSIRECVFQNVTQSDDGKKIQFYALTFSLLTQLCYHPPSYLHVLGPPESFVNISYTVHPCTGLQLEATSPVDPDTTIQCFVYYVSPDYDEQSILSLTFTTDNYTAVHVVPFHLFSHMTGEYKIVTTPVNTAGNGPSANIYFTLPTDDYSLDFRLNHVYVEIGHSSQFNAKLMVKVNQSCLLTVPNHLFINSSCSDGEIDYPVNMTHLLNEPNSGQIEVYHTLLPGKHNCTFTVRDEMEHVITMNTKIGTFHTASYQLYTNSSCVYVQCTFTPGTMAEGCMIVVYNEQGDMVDDILYARTNQSSSTDYVQLGPFNSGQYSLYIYDYIDGTFNESADPAFEEKLIIAQVNLLTTSSSSIASFSINPSATACLNHACRKSPVHINSIYIFIGTIVGVLVVMIAVVAVLIIIITCLRNKSKCQSYDLNEENDASGNSHVTSLFLNDSTREVNSSTSEYSNKLETK